jgi:hypothetical protein
MADDLRTAISSINLRSNLSTPLPISNSDKSELCYSSAGGDQGLDRRGSEDGTAARKGEGEAEPLAFDPRDLEELAYLGEGAGGAVMKVRSRSTGRVMAKKVGLSTAIFSC